MTLLTSYIKAWASHDIEGVLATLADDCVVTESYGPVYRGRDRVGEWMRAWLAEGGIVRSWTVNRDLSHERVLVAEWTFSCIWHGSPATFDGVTIAIADGDRLQELREYATTAELYEWSGTWR